MVSYQPWRFGDRDLVRELRARQFRRNAGASDDAHYLEQWRVSDDGPKKPKYLGERAARAFDDITGFSAAPGTTARPTEKEGGGGGNPFSRTLGGLKDLGGEVLSTGLEVLDAPRRYVGAPAFGVISGLTRSELYTDPKTGQQYRKSASFKDVGESLLAAVKDPVKAYREGAEATEQYFADPDKNVLHKAAGRAATDPLSFAGPGVARAAIRSVGLQGTRAGRVGYELLESGGPGVVLGGNVAGEAEAEYGQRIPGWNRLSPEARMLIASLTGGVAGGVAARRIGKRGLEGIPGAKQGFGSVIEDVSEPTMRDGFETFKHSDIKERPEMFQGRDADAGKTYGERKVKNIVENFDPMRLEPGLVVHDVSTGDYVVVRGHHRLEAMKRLSEQGKVPETGTWQVVDADLSKPQQVQQLRKMAVLSNYGTSETNLRAARVLLDEGADAGEIASQMRVTAQRADDLVHMSRLPADLIDRVVEMKADEGVAAEIARAASIYGLDEKDVRAMFGRYVTGSKSEISRTRLRSKLEQAGRMLAEERARGAQGGFGDIFGEGGWNDVRSEVLDVIDQLEARQNEITLSRQRLATVVRGLREFEDDPEIAREVATVRRAIEAKIQKLQEELDGITRDYETRRRARFEGTPDGGTRPDDRGIGEADRGAGGAIESPQQTGPGLFEEQPPVEAPPTVKRVDIEGNVTDTGRTEAEINRPTSMDEPLPTARPKETGFQQSFDASVQELPGFGPEAPPKTKAPRGPRAKKVEPDPGDSGRAPAPEQGIVRAEEPEARQQAGPEQEPPRPEEPKAEEPRAEEPKAEEPKGPPPPLDRTDDWTILGLKKGQRYTEDEIRAAYRAQARRYHPDLNISATAHADMRDINAAFERLMRGQGETHGTSGSRSGDDYREQARRQRRAQDEQTRANEEARARRKQRENPPPGGQSGPDPYDWWAAWGSKPPEWGEGPPPPPRPKGPTFKHFDQDARYDLFNAESRSAQVQKQQAYLRSLRGQLNQAFRGLVKKLGGERFDRNLILDTVVRPFVVGEKGRTDNLINHWTTWFREEAETKLKRAGITVAKARDGAWRINGDAAMPTIEDVIERSTDRGRAFYDALTPEQRQAIEFLEWGNEAVNKTILAHGGELPFDPDIEGTYFPRKVIGIGGNERTSGASSFKKSRTMESLDEGIGRDPDLGGRVEYDNPFDALEAGMRGKLRHAQDAYLRETLSPLAYKPNAAEGIRAGFGFDYVDHPALQGLLFKQDEADRIRAALQPGGENIFTRLPKAVNRVLTPLRATGDLSATFQQGMITWLRDPKAAAKHWATTVMSLKDPELYFKALDRLEADGPGLNEHIRWGGHYVNPHSTDEFLMPKVAKALSGGKYESIPVLGKVAQKSNEHFARFLNLARFDMANDAYKRALDLGLEGRALDDHMREAWNSINRATGWSARRPSTIEQLGLFAPRYFSASVEQVYTALTKGGIEGAIARRHLIRLTAAGATVAWLWNEANGHETEWDPRSNNFLRLRDVGGLDVSVFGTYDTLIRAVAGTVAGQAGDGIKPDVKRPVKFLESKMSPAMKLLYEPFVARETYLGEPLDVSTPGGAAKAVFEQAKSSIPFNVQDLIEEGPTAGFVGSTGLSARLLTEKEKLDRERDKLANTMFGRPYEQLGGKEKAQVNERESVTKIQAAKDAQDLRRGGDAARRVKIRQEFATRMAANAEFLKRGEDDAGNPFGGNDYREAYHELQTYLAGQRDTLKDISGDDKEVDGWFDLYDKAKMSNGQIDSEKLDALQADYRAKHPGIDEKVDQVTGIRDDPTLREYREAQKLAKKYYDIPAYRGMTLKDSRRAGEILKLAQGMVQSGEARNTKHALALLTAYDAEGVTLARRATRLGSNPQRRQFRLANPLFGRFYTNAASVLG